MLYLIVNETSRTGKAAEVWQELQKDIINLEIPYTVYKTEYAGHALKLAEDICQRADEDKCILALGGDGTMNEIINGIKDFDDVRFGIVPLGSGNDFGRGLGITGDWRKNLNNVVKNVKKGKDCYKAVDLGMVEWGKDKHHYFGISSGIGLDAIVTKRVNDSLLKKLLNKLHIGKMSYSIMTVFTLFTMTTFDFNIDYVDMSDNHKMESHNRTIFSANMNLRAEGGNVPMAPDATGFNSVLTMCTASGIPKWKTFFLLPLLLKAKHTNVKGFDLVEYKTATIETSIPVTLHADGEYLGQINKAKFTCIAGKLRLLN